MRKFFMWLFRAALFITGFIAFLTVMGESTEVVEPWYFFVVKFAAIGVIALCCRAYMWSLSPAEKAELEREDA